MLMGTTPSLVSGKAQDSGGSRAAVAAAPASHRAYAASPMGGSCCGVDSGSDDLAFAPDEGSAGMLVARQRGAGFWTPVRLGKSWGGLEGPVCAPHRVSVSPRAPPSGFAPTGPLSREFAFRGLHARSRCRGVAAVHEICTRRHVRRFAEPMRPEIFANVAA